MIFLLADIALVPAVVYNLTKRKLSCFRIAFADRASVYSVLAHVKRITVKQCLKSFLPLRFRHDFSPLALYDGN